MRQFIFLLLLLAVLVLVGFFVFRAIPNTALQQQIITIRETQFAVDVVRTPIAQARGLSGRTLLAANAGMLFIFDAPQLTGFWMKDMFFPIDIIWITDNRVVGFVEHAQPDDRPERTIYYPPVSIDTVLEVPSGTITRSGIHIGDAVQ